MPHNDIVSINYFTARVSGTPNDPSKPNRQDIYLRALETHIPGFRVHLGNFMSHSKDMRLVADPKRTARVIHTEEKGSDVNLSVSLLNDAWLDKYDCAVVVSNDSDLAEAIKLSRERGKVVGVVTVRRQINMDF